MITSFKATYLHLHYCDKKRLMLSTSNAPVPSPLERSLQDVHARVMDVETGSQQRSRQSHADQASSAAIWRCHLPSQTICHRRFLNYMGKNWYTSWSKDSMFAASNASLFLVPFISFSSTVYAGFCRFISPWLLGGLCITGLCSICMHMCISIHFWCLSRCLCYNTETFWTLRVVAGYGFEKKASFVQINFCACSGTSQIQRAYAWMENSQEKDWRRPMWWWRSVLFAFQCFTWDWHVETTEEFSFMVRRKVLVVKPRNR